ncbi:C2 domain protein [Necator americanus]|nr:C2 domain protein [Necator americanus]ETN82678.1 C2 domain protein [Necator americanus]
MSLDANLGLLTVSLKQAYDLPSKRQDDNPNPYFRVALDIPDGTKTQQQTKTFRATTSPEIGEDFYFQIPAAHIASCRLEIMVYDYDQFSVDECVGYCWLTLGRLSVSLEKENPTVFWAEVLPYDENGGSGFGEVLFSLAYLSQAQRLTMNIFKARNLRCRGDGAISIRVSLIGNDEKRLKRKKTVSRRNVRNAQFNESLTFGVPKRSLCDVSLEIEAMHESGTFGMTTEVIGRMELPLHRCKDLWRAIIHEEKSQARWYPLEEP